MASTLRLYYDAVIAVALMAVVAIACGVIAALITGDSSPNFPVAAIALLLIGAFIFLRLWSAAILGLGIAIPAHAASEIDCMVMWDKADVNKNGTLKGKDATAY